MHTAQLSLSSSEITRARHHGFEVEVGSAEDTNLWWCKVIGESVDKLISFLRTLKDLRDLTYEELERYISS